MGVLEAGILVTPRGVREGVEIPVRGVHDLYFDVVVAPGLSDAHAHPQVVDAGRSPPSGWRDAYEWLEKRRLRVDEASLRKDVEAAAGLARATLMLSVLDGVTLTALTGSFQANLKAVDSLGKGPRTVFTPTVMDRDGWSTPQRVAAQYLAHLSRWDGYYRVGLFLHSLRRAGPEMTVSSYKVARSLGLTLALHLSEGVDEADELAGLLGDTEGVVAVHCIEAPEKCRRLGLRVVHCPASNLYLYRRTLRRLDHFDALGSDWPLLTGTLLDTLRLAAGIHGPSARLLAKATLGGYRVFGVDWRGDYAAFTGSLRRVLRGEARPAYVFVKGEPVVEEGLFNGLSRRDAERLAEEQVKLALERHGV